MYAVQQYEFTDGQYIYYVSALIGSDTWAVCKREADKKPMGIHKYRSPKNPTVSTPEEAYSNMVALAKKKGWRLIKAKEE